MDNRNIGTLIVILLIGSDIPIRRHERYGELKQIADTPTKILLRAPRRTKGGRPLPWGPYTA